MLEFVEDTHKYYFNYKEIPSVSEIMKGISNYYYTKDIPEIALARACEKGTAVHKAIENYLLFDDENIEDRYSGYFEQFKSWFNKYKPKVLYVEKQLTDGTYAGTIDLICEIGGLTYLIDYKTSNELHTKLVSVQTTAYDELCTSNKIYIDKRYALHLARDEYEFIELDDEDKIWNNLLENYKYMEE